MKSILQKKVVHNNYYLKLSIHPLYFQGLDITEKGLDLISHLIRNMLQIDCAVLMGANIAGEVAHENYCEATIGRDVIETLLSDTVTKVGGHIAVFITMFMLKHTFIFIKSTFYVYKSYNVPK